MEAVLVTGGAGGIGSEIVKEFAEKGFFVYVVDNASDARQRLSGLGISHWELFPADVTDADALAQLHGELTRQEVSLKHIVTLAGRAMADEWQSFSLQDIGQIRRSVEVNLLGHIQVVHTFLDRLQPGKASVTMISSINAMAPFGLPAYSAAKAGLYGFMTAMVPELGKLGIRINCISPGTVVTPATLQEDKDFTALLQTSPMGCFATAQQIARTAYLLAEEMPTVTGQNLVVDAGQSC